MFAALTGIVPAAVHGVPAPERLTKAKPIIRVADFREAVDAELVAGRDAHDVFW